MWVQKEVDLIKRPRGFHLVTRDVLSAVPELGAVKIGLLHLFMQHTSASLAINENADPDVRAMGWTPPTYRHQCARLI